MLSFDGFQLDSHFFSRCHVGAQINVSETAAPNLPPQAVLLADAEFHDHWNERTPPEL